MFNNSISLTQEKLIIFQYPGMDFSKADLQKNYDSIPGFSSK